MPRIVTHRVQLFDSPEPNPADYVHLSPASPGNLLADLKWIGGSIILDRSWAPYVQATFVVALPSPAVLDLIDPRVVTRRVFVTTTSTLPDGSGAIVRTFDLMLRARTVDWLGGTVTLSAASDEARLIDLLATSTSTRSGMDVSTYITGWLFAIWLNWGTGTALPPFSGLAVGADARLGSDDSSTALQETIGQSFWDSLQPVLDATGLRLWVDEARQWHLDKADRVSSTEVDLSYLDGLVAASDSIDRNGDQWADQVVATYTWTDNAGNPHTAFDVAGGPGGSTRGLAFNYSSPKPAGGAAARIRAKLRARGRSLELRNRADWTARPDQVFTALVSDALPVQRGYITRVELDLAADQMTLTTRGVIGGATKAWIVTPAGTSWASIPAGVAWSTYDAGDDLWSVQPAGRSWQTLPSGTSWAGYSTN